MNRTASVPFLICISAGLLLQGGRATQGGLPPTMVPEPLGVAAVPQPGAAADSVELPPKYGPDFDPYGLAPAPRMRPAADPLESAPWPLYGPHFDPYGLASLRQNPTLLNPAR